MEDSSEQQQWSWALAVGAVFALYGVCSLYNWFATILGNIRFRPRPQSPPAADAAPATHPSKLTLPTFWISEPAAWFALAEAKFHTSNITSQRVMFDLLVAALPEKHLSQVMDIIKAIPAINPYEVLKLRLLEAHVLSDQEKMDALFQLGPLGDRKPSQLLASVLSVCPFGDGASAGVPVPFLAAASPDAQDASRRTGVRRHLRPGGVGGQTLGVPQTSAPRGDGGPGAGQQRAAGGRRAAQEEALQEEDRRRQWRRRFQRQRRCSLPR